MNVAHVIGRVDFAIWLQIHIHESDRDKKQKKEAD